MSNIVQSILSDKQDNIWIGTSNGMIMMNTRTESFRKFILDDGLSGNEFNTDALIYLNDGRFVAGTTKGLDVFNPASVNLNQNLPKIVFTSIEILNHPVQPGDLLNGRVILTQNIDYVKELKLTNKEKTFSLTFAALNYSLPQKCAYRYKLEGFEEEWNETSGYHRKATYSNLPPDEYTFRLIASNDDGKWGNNERKLIIKVLPPFYNTILFKSILIVLFSVLIYFIYQYRLNLHKSSFLKKQAEQDKKIIQLEKENLESELQKLTFHIINRNRLLIDQKTGCLDYPFRQGRR
ncbi:MAG: hypothetical protein HC906_11975 [Bacteroidales bacterium]|nr:hypothetical protein [Bacteroidales bacterium]